MHPLFVSKKEKSYSSNKSYVLPPQYSTSAFSDTRPKNKGVYVTLSPQGSTHIMYLAALQCILSEY